MPSPQLRFLVLVKYNAEAWRKLVSYPENRVEAVRPVVQRLGGIIIQKDLVSQGEYDLVATMEFPSTDAAQAFYMAVMAGGAVSEMKMMRLLSIEEGMRVMKMAGTARYTFFSSDSPGSGSAQATRAGERTARRPR
jgi:uncharacterized protein with GYD domain